MKVAAKEKFKLKTTPLFPFDLGFLVNLAFTTLGPLTRIPFGIHYERPQFVRGRLIPGPEMQVRFLMLASKLHRLLRPSTQDRND
jgi:hypothetical protein